VDAVRAVLAGADLCEVAAAHGLATQQLSAAISACHEAGTADDALTDARVSCLAAVGRMPATAG
jgi:transposase-like protein